MKRSILLGAAVAIALLLFSPHHAWAFGVKDVIEMSQDGISDDLVLEKIQHSGKTFHLDADDIHDLKEAGVSDVVISAMLRTEDAAPDEGYDGNGIYYAYPYPCPYPYPAPLPSYPRVIVGVGIGHSHGYRHGGPYYDRGPGGRREEHGGGRYGGGYRGRGYGGGGYGGGGQGGHGGGGGRGGGGRHGR